MRLVTLLALSACVTVEGGDHQTFSAAGITRVVADLDAGSFSYIGDSDTTGFDIDVVSEGYGSGQAKAAEREAGNEWTFALDGTDLDITTDTQADRAAINVTVDGPDLMNLDIVSAGEVTLDDVEGMLIVDAAYLTGTALIGNADLPCSGGMEVDVSPWDDGTGGVTIVAEGDTVLYLPYGYEYDVEVWGSIEHEITITDLGFDEEAFADGYYAGVAGLGTIPIQVSVEGGSFTLLESN